MQRDRDGEICLIHFTWIHRLALPDIMRSLTAMLLCMIAPGLDGSMTVRSIRRFFPLEAFLTDSPLTQQSLPGTLLTTGGSQTAGTFGASPVGLLPGAYFYATLCVPSQCLHVTKLQYVTSVYCMRVLECTLRMPSVKSRCSKLSSMSSVQTKLGFGLVRRMPRASSEQVKNSMFASVDSIWLHGLDMPHMSRTVMYLSAAQSCGAYWPTELVMFSVKSFGFFCKYLKIGYPPKKIYCSKTCFFPWPWPFGGIPTFRQSHLGPTFQCKTSGFLCWFALINLSQTIINSNYVFALSAFGVWPFGCCDMLWLKGQASMGRAMRLIECFELQYLTGQVDTMVVMMTGLESTGNRYDRPNKLETWAKETSASLVRREHWRKTECEHWNHGCWRLLMVAVHEGFVSISFALDSLVLRWWCNRHGAAGLPVRSDQFALQYRSRRTIWTEAIGSILNTRGMLARSIYISCQSFCGWLTRALGCNLDM